MATATKKQSPRRTVKPAAAKTVVKAASKRKTAAKAATPTVKSVTGTFQRGKRDRETREIMPHEPTAGGGVRFEEIADNGKSPVYITQQDDNDLGKPQKIRVTVARLA